MSTDFQAGRVALGARLRELRTEAGLNGKGIAERLGWQRSKVSRLETGKQTATVDDLEAWAAATGAGTEAADLKSRLRGLESQQRSWRRQLSTGHRGVQEKYVAEYRATSTVRGYEATVIPGLFQTPDYARHLLLHNADLMGSPRDTDAAVSARMKRQEVLYESGRSFNVLVWEGALHAVVCPKDVMAAQLDRLAGLIGLSTVSLGILPLGASLSLTPKHGFWIFDDRRVVVEIISTELQLESDDDVALYRKVWDRLNGAAVYGPRAHRLIGRARASLDLM
ncbi:helix-turn-helix transcriptional regulator [Streptomyces sp. NBC_01591]|uniref:helix-turn-helix domain-containing protein n=1 Tax=Streptomyces sp. NBC_01591 TaxID=2975888 RepID=UPI002DDA2307|nr:helix-turn-helix transcriptional regulator [Streptomyces sp. NBC_01591]WSD71708.1 helix-turn-helix transcriptional regulator [Streptomyces sp. NBC_01591]